MKIFYYEDPIPHVIIDNVYDNEELNDIWSELKFLTNKRKFEPPANTNSAIDSVGNQLKDNHGVWISDIFQTHPHISNILTHCVKLFDRELLYTLSKHHFIFRYLFEHTRYHTLLSYYEDGQSYGSHIDKSIISICNWFFEEPKKFSGGDLFFTDFNYKIPIMNNRAVIFPSKINHHVDNIIMNQSNSKSFSGTGRYVVTHFVV